MRKRSMFDPRSIVIALLMAFIAAACGGATDSEPGSSAGAPGAGQAGEAGSASAGKGGASGGGGDAGGSGEGGNAGSSGEGGDAGGSGEPCLYDGLPREVGVPFLCGCNMCWCLSDGSIEGTAVGCACFYDDVTYEVGDSFAHKDGCNQCTCDDWDSISCTEAACACDPAREYWRDYIENDARTCTALDYACPPNTRHFSNECGCGCEQDDACGQTIDCNWPGILECEGDGPIHCPYSKLK